MEAYLSVNASSHSLLPSLFSSITTKIGTAENWPLNGRFMTPLSPKPRQSVAPWRREGKGSMIALLRSLPLGRDPTRATTRRRAMLNDAGVSLPAEEGRNRSNRHEWNSEEREDNK